MFGSKFVPKTWYAHTCVAIKPGLFIKKVMLTFSGHINVMWRHFKVFVPGEPIEIWKRSHLWFFLSIVMSHTFPWCISSECNAMSLYKETTCISSTAAIIKNRCFNITDSTPCIPYAILFNMQKLNGRNIEIALCILRTLVIRMSHKAWKDKRQCPSEAFFFSKVSN